MCVFLKYNLYIYINIELSVEVFMKERTEILITYIH